MNSKIRPKMPVSERAKIFMPFAALKGLPQALAEKERIVVPKMQLSQDLSEELNQKLLSVECGKLITAVYYSDGEYVKITGMLVKLDTTFKRLQIVDTVISFSDLIDIQMQNIK